MRKNILIIIIVVVSVFVALLLYFFIFRKTDSPISANNTSDNSNSLSVATGNNVSMTNPAVGLNAAQPQSDAMGNVPVTVISEDTAAQQLPILQKLINTEVVGAALAAENMRLQYFDALEGNLVSVSLLGTDPIILASIPDSIEKIIWSPNRASLLYRSPAAPFKFTKLDSWDPVELNSEIQRPVFTDDSVRIVYQYFDPSRNISNISIGTPSQQITDFNVLAKISGNLWVKRIPGQNKVAYYLESKSDRPSGVKALGLNSQQEEILINEGLGTDVTWNNDGTKMAFTQLNSKRELQLYLADGDGRNVRPVDRATYVEKIAWDPSGQFLYIAVPKKTPDLRSFYQDRAMSDDIIYQVDINTGYSIPAWDLTRDPNNKLDARDMFVSPGGKLLFFENAKDQSLYVLNLMMVHQDMELGAPVSRP